jgi:hypothetical protein
MSDIMSQLQGLDTRFQVDPVSIDLEAPIPTRFVSDDEDYTTDDEEYDSEDSLDLELTRINAQLQWEESLLQLKTLLNIVIFPIIGKAVGRKMAGFSMYYPLRSYFEMAWY